MYLRFVAEDSNSDRNPLRQTGLVTMVALLKKSRKLNMDERRIANDAFKWLSQHVPCPPFRANRESGLWTKDAVSWWLIEHRSAVQPLMRLVDILRIRGIRVRGIVRKRPGKIVYRDSWQIVAETPSRSSRTKEIDV